MNAGDCRLLVTDPLEGFGVRIKIAGYGGVALAMPVVLWQEWQFIAPGLYAKEKRYAAPFVGAGVALFGFQLPLIVTAARLVGLVTNHTLRSVRRYVMVAIVLVVADVTPSADPYSLLTLAVPMYVSYELALLVGRFAGR